MITLKQPSARHLSLESFQKIGDISDQENKQSEGPLAFLVISGAGICDLGEFLDNIKIIIIVYFSLNNHINIQIHHMQSQ